MSFGLIADVTTASLRAALDGLDRRQQAIANNISNIETPGYLAQEVAFEDSLRAAIAGGRPEQFTITQQSSLAPTRNNGNNVNIDREILDSSETLLRQRLVIQGLNSKYSILRTAITGR